MSDHPPTPAARRQRRRRRRQRLGLIVVPVEIGERHLGALVKAGWLEPSKAENTEHVGKAVGDLVENLARGAPTEKIRHA